MKTIIATAAFATTILASAIAMADETTATSTVSSTTATAQSPTMQPQQTTAPAATTTVTSGDPNDATITPIAPSSAPPRESVTLYDRHTPNKALLYTGTIAFAGAYVTTAAITAANPDTLDKSLYLPIVGPWLTLAQASDYSTGKTVLIAGSGIIQGLGAGLALASLFIPEKTATTTISAGNVKMNILPASYGAGSAGVGAVGTF